MLSLRSLAARKTTQSLCKQCLLHKTPSRTIASIRATQNALSRSAFPKPSTQSTPLHPGLTRTYAMKSTADSLIEEIQDQYATARDEFEIATEETEKKTVYAADDRAAAREELDKLKQMFDDALKGSDGEEIKGRVGGRIRELENALTALEESALED